MNTKKVTLVFLFFLFLVFPLFAQNLMPSGMQSLAEGILYIFTSGFMRIILVIFLCGAAIAYAFNKDNEQMKKKIIAIGIAIGILIGATGIVDAIWSAAR